MTEVADEVDEEGRAAEDADNGGNECGAVLADGKQDLMREQSDRSLTGSVEKGDVVNEDVRRVVSGEDSDVEQSSEIFDKEQRMLPSGVQLHQKENRQALRQKANRLSATRKWSGAGRARRKADLRDQ
jgi:hypothetical protein